MHRFVPAAVCVWLTCSALALAVDPFSENIRSTPPRTPDDERKVFHLPPGFEIQLVASEPEIAKPLNMAFDAQGRLWITQTKDYPFPAQPGKGRDAVQILEDFAPDGRARKITTFADGLTIPMGLYPFKDGAIAFSIPYIYRMSDPGGDGKATKRDVLYGPFGFERDTHGLTSSFRRGFDGWLYACHGYNNTTTIKGADGRAITMNSGNTYRMRLDGSHVEQFTWGQVNPFGIAFDSLGNMYTADCETLPIYQLLRGAYYPSFGKPDDGLGYGPSMMNHKHGSTAIGGIACYADDRFPAEFRDNIVIGNVVTSRINRDALEDHGSTRLAQEQSDFVSTDDPWFRPVDLQLGPDGAIYVADFYNRIIGHYEVALNHPGRDRERGRVWRIVYRGDGKQAPRPVANLAKASAAELIDSLSSPNLTVRMLATNELVDRVGKAAIGPVQARLRGMATATQKIHGLWALFRLDGLDKGLLASAAKDADRGVRVHAMRILSETERLSPEQRDLVLNGLKDADGFVARAAADALGRHADFDNVRPLVELLKRVPSDDTHLAHVVRMALRNQMIPGENLSRASAAGWDEKDMCAIADVAVAIPSPEAGTFLLKHVERAPVDRDTAARFVRHAMRHLPTAELDAFARVVQTKFAGDLDLQLALFKSAQEGAAQRGVDLPAGIREWAAEMADKLLSTQEPQPSDWTSTPLAGQSNPANPWAVETRQSSDGDSNSPFLSSLPRGEQLTGVLRSKPFALPERLSFFAAGHNGLPPRTNPPKNVIRLREAGTDKVLAEALPPRSDLAQPVRWDLKAHAGKQGYLELVDGDDAEAYAWLAVGRFSPPVVRVPLVDPSQASQRRTAALEIAASLRLVKLEPRLKAIALDRAADGEVRVAAAKSLAVLNAGAAAESLAAVLNDTTEAISIREAIGQTLGESSAPDALAVLAAAINAAPERLQAKLALFLAGSKDGAEILLKSVAEGKAAPRLLQDRSIREKLIAVAPVDLEKRIEALTKGLPPADQRLQQLLADRLAAFNAEKASAADGAKVFEKHCAACHRVEGQGGNVGPMLDGIGLRGLDRIVEDLLDPSRNVDPMFRSSIVTTTDGRVFTGLQRREEGEVVVFADSTGKEVSVPKQEIESRKDTRLSLMPENLVELIPADDFNHLLAFLLSKRNPQKAEK